MKKAVFWDRDGTLIENKHYLNDPSGIEYLPGVVEALALLRDVGFIFVVVTNQSGVPRGIVSVDDLTRIHQKMDEDLKKHSLSIERFYYSPYMPESDHPSRKPNPGMLLQAADELGIDLAQSWMVGDKMLDVEAGHRAGVKSILLGNNEVGGDSTWRPPEYHVANLQQCAQCILREIA